MALQLMWKGKGKAVCVVLSVRPRAVLKIEGTVSSYTDRPRLVINMFTFFSVCLVLKMIVANRIANSLYALYKYLWNEKGYFRNVNAIIRHFEKPSKQG